MVVEYDISCHQETLFIEFPNEYKNREDDIIEILDDCYQEWHLYDEIEDPIQEYMIEKLSEYYDMWTWWFLIYEGDDETELSKEIIVTRNSH